MRATLAMLICILFMGCQSPQTKEEENVPHTAADKAAANTSVSFILPDGFMGRSQKGAYIVYSDSVEKHNGHNVSTIKAVNPVSFATILNNLTPQKCIGQRIKYTAWVRCKDVANWAGLWLRIDPSDPRHNPNLGFDNMHNRPIKGTADWTKYEIVMDVPEGAANVVYGALLDGGGQIWIDSIEVKIVDKLTPTTTSTKVL